MAKKYTRQTHEDEVGSEWSLGCVGILLSHLVQLQKLCKRKQYQPLIHMKHVSGILIILRCEKASMIRVVVTLLNYFIYQNNWLLEVALSKKIHLAYNRSHQRFSNKIVPPWSIWSPWFRIILNGLVWCLTADPTWQVHLVNFVWFWLHLAAVLKIRMNYIWRSKIY